MALNITSTFAGIASQEFYTRAFFQSRTLKGELLHVLPNVKDKIAMRRLYSGAIVQADSCNFSESGDLTLDERILDPAKLKINTELCYDTLESSWESEKLRAGANNTDAMSIEQFILNEYSQKLADEMDTLIWSGSTDMTGVWELVSETGSTVTQLTGVTITSSNVIAEMKKVYEAYPEELMEDYQNSKIFVSHAIAKAYKLALATSTGDANFAVYGDKPLDFLGFEVVPVSLPANKMVMASVKNLGFGTDLLSDFNEFNIVDMRQTTGDRKIRVTGRFKAGVQYAYGNEIVAYGVN